VCGLAFSGLDFRRIGVALADILTPEFGSDGVELNAVNGFHATRLISSAMIVRMMCFFVVFGASRGAGFWSTGIRIAVFAGSDVNDGENVALAVIGCGKSLLFISSQKLQQLRKVRGNPPGLRSSIARNIDFNLFGIGARRPGV